MNSIKDLSNNIKAFETFIMNGSFAEKQQSEKNCKAAKEALKSKLYHSEEKRHVFEKHGMVAKFVTSEVKDTDNFGLIEDILNYIRSEALSQVISFNKKYLEANELMDIVEPYQYDPTYYLKATLNKNGQSYNHSLEEDFHEQDIDFLLKSVKSYNQQFDTL
ncbi:hypothetical protein LG296_21160 (plasmid) [Ureibacillus chungkukjangi]|uniref:hypothetical protein n=1 Tax=Ureibacillus chungkukjangi TaxID=1202712 RepID=UPI000D3AA161|nr:hypothetical protein [Ureibacillus chungkukjangi]MCM3390198.1 hypothetical protein [Ureibacillus chungkukjangi]